MYVFDDLRDAVPRIIPEEIIKGACYRYRQLFDNLGRRHPMSIFDVGQKSRRNSNLLRHGPERDTGPFPHRP